jgi:ClpP class serine protease
MTKPHSRALAWAATTPWAIQREALDHLLAIAQREHAPDFDAVLAKQGQRLAQTADVRMRGDIAVVSITGPIFRYANLFTAISGATSIEQTALDFRTALEDPTVRGIVLAIDSPGGAVAGISDFAQHVRAASARKPVVAFVDGMAASAAYWIAAAASWVVTSNTGTLGSIGVVAGVRLNDDEKLVEIVSSQSPNKRPDVRTDAGRAQIQQHVDELAQVFIESVARYRDVSPAHVLQEFGQGGVKLGRSAVTADMADQVSTLEQLLADMGADGHPAVTLSRRLKAIQSAAPAMPATRADESKWGATVAAINAQNRRSQP